MKTLQQALTEATEYTPTILIKNPHPYARKSYLRRKLRNRKGQPAVKANNFWHIIVAAKKVSKDPVLWVFIVEEEDQYHHLT